MPENDGFYIQRCLDGHPDDFRHLVRRYKGPLLGYLAGLLRRSDLAEEALQEVFVRCYFGLSSLEKPESFFAWMLGVANRVAKEQLRIEQKQKAGGGKTGSNALSIRAAAATGPWLKRLPNSMIFLGS